MAAYRELLEVLQPLPIFSMFGQIYIDSPIGLVTETVERHPTRHPTSIDEHIEGFALL